MSLRTIKINQAVNVILNLISTGWLFFFSFFLRLIRTWGTEVLENTFFVKHWGKHLCTVCWWRKWPFLSEMRPNILIPHRLPPATHVTSFILSNYSKAVAFITKFIKVSNDQQWTSCCTFIDPSRYCIHLENLLFCSWGYFDFCSILCAQRFRSWKTWRVFFAHTQRKFWMMSFLHTTKWLEI